MSEKQNSGELSELCKIEPISVDHAAKLREEINTGILRIDSQLADPNREYGDGSRMESQDYWDWRKRATSAQAFARQRMGYLRRWIASEAQQKDSDKADLMERQVKALERIADTLEGRRDGK